KAAAFRRRPKAIPDGTGGAAFRPTASHRQSRDMILALDVGNSHIFGGIFEDGALRFQFRKASRPPAASDELGVFLRAVLRENGHDPSRVDRVAICSVVPDMLY